MTTDNLKTLIRLAHAHPGPVASAVLAAAYGYLVHPKLLQQHLMEAGFHGDLTRKEGDRYELRLTNQADELLAWSNAPTADEALLHAILGFLRECDSGQRCGSAAAE